MRFVYVTVGSAEEAHQIAETVVTERLAACANVLPAVRSYYRWEGALQRDDETVIVLKTADDKLESLTRRIVALHSYDCPCVVAMPVVGGHPAFLEWIGTQTSSD